MNVSQSVTRSRWRSVGLVWSSQAQVTHSSKWLAAAAVLGVSVLRVLYERERDRKRERETKCESEQQQQPSSTAAQKTTHTHSHSLCAFARTL